jgi:DNA-binding NarL/FixJ family response regulator
MVAQAYDESNFQTNPPSTHDAASSFHAGIVMSSGEAVTSVARTRVLIAEDQALVRRGTQVLLSMEPDMEVVGQACDGVEAVSLAMSLRPDVILMDLHMPRQGGVAATREITQALPATQVLVLTTLDDDETVFAAVRAGAQGYLLKDATEQELLETIRALMRGESRLTPQIARKVMDQFRELATEADRASPTGSPTEARRGAKPGVRTEALSEKEDRILQLITDGMSNRQIAAAMYLAEGTVKNYVSRIMDKLHANTRTALAVISARQRRP